MIINILKFNIMSMKSFRLFLSEAIHPGINEQPVYCNSGRGNRIKHILVTHVQFGISRDDFLLFLP